jgi:hypothetical protein
MVRICTQHEGGISRAQVGACAVPQFVPFIQGPRNCLGQYFALLEARIVLGLLVKVPPSCFTCCDCLCAR